MSRIHLTVPAFRSRTAGCAAAVIVAFSPATSALAGTLLAEPQGAVVGEFLTGLPPGARKYEAFRIPLGLLVEARASDRFSLFFDLRASLNTSGSLARNIGNPQALAPTAPQVGTEFDQPFSRGSARGEVVEPLLLAGAYLSINSEVGKFRVGRMPRHWGLGLWRSAEWVPEGGTTSYTDALQGTIDIGPFSVSASWEKSFEGNPFQSGDDADAYTLEGMIADDQSDPGSSEVVRQVGAAYSSYSHKRSETSLSIMDLFGKVYYGRLLVEGEFLYPSGSTRSPAYEGLGGAGICPAANNANGDYLTCGKQKLAGAAALFRTRFQLVGMGASGGSNSLAETDMARLRMPTSLRAESHTVGLWAGFARGDADEFKGAANKDDSISSFGMHPNIRPSLMMFGAATSAEPGMPGRSVSNATFVRAEYSYEAPGVGLITPALIWGRLNSLNKSAPTQDSVGHTASLGFELNTRFQYVTTDKVSLGVEGGVWLPGKAWATLAHPKPEIAFGLRTSVGTVF